MNQLNNILEDALNDLNKIIFHQNFSDQYVYGFCSRGYLDYSNSRKPDHNEKYVEALNFDMGISISSLVNKLAGAHVLLRREREEFEKFGYVNHFESRYLFDLIFQLINRVREVAGILELSIKKNRDEIEQVTNLMKKINTEFNSVIKLSLNGYLWEAQKNREKAEELRNENPEIFFRRLIKGYKRHKQDLEEKRDCILCYDNLAALADERRHVLENI